MRLIVGLGNPGKEYEKTRHNVGFNVVDLYLKQNKLTLDKSKFNGKYVKTNINGEEVIFLEPQTYMNNSGKAVSEAAKFYKIPIEKIIVLSDDISLDVGRLRVRRNGSHGGQRGLLSIEEHMSSREYPRIKIGVGQKPHPEYDLADWVLSNFSADELKKINENLDTVFEGLCKILSGDLEGAMQICNHK